MSLSHLHDELLFFFVLPFPFNRLSLSPCLYLVDVDVPYPFCHSASLLPCNGFSITDLVYRCVCICISESMCLHSCMYMYISVLLFNSYVIWFWLRLIGDHILSHPPPIITIFSIDCFRILQSFSFPNSFLFGLIYSESAIGKSV